jgi:uncharacterized protein YydD (DUF2326 family)
MKLASLYSNLDELFPRIVFKEGLNVIFGLVKDKNLSNKDSHNLGKTFLISVIEFCLLSDIKDDHPFRKHKEQFLHFVFYLEIETNSGRHITIRRAVSSYNKASIRIENERNKVLVGLPENEWNFSALSLKKAIEALDGFLDLSVIAPYNYRKGLSYCLRRQSDYLDEFRTSKFVISKDAYWKPYMSKILGFDDSILDRKYELDTEIDKEQQKQKNLEVNAGSKSTEFDEIKGIIQIKEDYLARAKANLTKMDFRQNDKHIVEEDLNSVDARIQDYNEELYSIDAQIRQIDKSLESEYSFDLGNIERVFAEAAIAFAPNIKKSYEDLIEFNRRLSKSRNQHLRFLRKDLIDKKSSIEDSAALYSDKRGKLLSELIEAEAFEKFITAQRGILEKERELIELRANLDSLNQAGKIENSLRNLKIDRSSIIAEITEEIHKQNDTYTSIRRNFSRNVEFILNTEALLSVNLNSSGNLEFKIKTIDAEISGRETSEGLGTSYKKMLCACFDMAILTTYSSLSFYRFVYHDGIFEGLDNRRKVNLLERARDLCRNYGIQYILSVIDSDMPRDNTDNALLFSEDEIVRSLHDDGDNGRLFRRQKF